MSDAPRRGPDLVGMVFGRLTALCATGRGGYFLCLCECGTRIEVRRNNLMLKHQVSCGCYRSERMTAINKMKWEK